MTGASAWPPAVVGGVSLFDGDEYAAAGSGDLAAARELGLDHHAIPLNLGGCRLEVDRAIERRGGAQLDVKFGGHGAGRRFAAALAHQRPGRGPVAVAIEQTADDAAAQHALERLVVRFGRPVGDHPAFSSTRSSSAGRAGSPGRSRSTGCAARALLEPDKPFSRWTPVRSWGAPSGRWPFCRSSASSRRRVRRSGFS